MLFLSHTYIYIYIHRNFVLSVFILCQPWLVSHVFPIYIYIYIYIFIYKHIVHFKWHKNQFDIKMYDAQIYACNKTPWVIYLITCTLRRKQYVGKTETTLYGRLSNTMSDIINFYDNAQATRLPYTTLFSLAHHKINNVRITGIESVTKQSHTAMTITHCHPSKGIILV